MERNGGFTLFELLIAVFIGTILIMSSAYAIRLGLFSMEREEVWFNNSTKEKASFDFFWQQVSSLYILKATSDNTNDKKNTPAPSLMESKKKKVFIFQERKMY
ncbi:MAG: prepilin-type N-terminal cleavage/methylation domain-containing protein [Candidatus Jettenia sp.]|nr:MAG: prepilin-type N-terminal cleavage/methylation domain-containing protein [Candidatus Jettenia sp.]